MTTCGRCSNMLRDAATYAKISVAFESLNRARRQKTAIFLPGRLEDLGICQEKKDTVVGPTSGACEKFKERT